MGWFSSKKKTSVDTAVMRVIEDEDVSDTVKEATIEAIIDNGSVSEHVVDGVLNGVGLRFERMWRYGRDKYHYGLPNDNLITPQDGTPQVKELLEANHGASVALEYFHVMPINNIHFARKKLVDEYGYDQASNEIKTLSRQFGHKVYLVDLQAMYTPRVAENAEEDFLAVWDLPGTAGYTPDRPRAGVGQYAKHTGMYVDEETPFDGARVFYAYWIDGTPIRGTLDFEVTEFTTDTDYVQAKYTVQGQPGVHYWTYRLGSNEYPTVDAAYNPSFTNKGTYFPFVVFRRQKINRTSSSYHNSNEYKTTSKMLEYIGMDYQSLGDTIHDNPDIKDVEQAVMAMAVPAKSKDPLDIRYLFEYFKGLYLDGYTSPLESPRLDSFSGGLFGRLFDRVGKRTLVWQDADFTWKLSYRDIQIRRIPKKTGPIGTYTSRQGSIRRTETYTVRQRNPVTYQYEEAERTRAYYVRGHQYFKQITSSICEEVTIMDPVLRYDIWDGHGVNAETGSSELLIPLDKRITDSFALPDRERLYMRSMHFIFNSRVTKKVKWYQSGIFKAILVIAAVVITIYTGLPAWKAAAAISATAAVSAIAMSVLSVVVKAIAAKYVFKFTVKHLGEEAAFIAAIAAAIYGGVKAFQHGSIQGAPWASEALAASTGLLNAIGASYQKKILALQNDMAEYEDYKQDMMSELDRIEALLDGPNLLNPVLFIQGESPENFYRRTIHSGNMAELTIDSVHKFVAASLTLPDTHSTLKELTYV